nr:hypothetical protein [Tanacetum cinerariifolium]
IKSDKIDPHYFNIESDFVESLSNRDTLFDSSLKFDYLEEIYGELMPTSIIDEERIRREHKEYISLLENIEDFDYDSEGDIYFLEELLFDDSIHFLKNKSSNFDHHDDPAFPRPPPEPPDVEFFFDFEPNSEEVISDELNEDECFDLGGEID